MRIVVSGGGTGGHIMPALAVAESLCRMVPDAERLYIGAHTGMESEIVPRLGVPYQPITTQKLYKTFSLSSVKVMLSVWKGYHEAITYLRAFRADVVVGTGGYVAAAAIMAGRKLGIPTFIHEGNAVAGRTNLWLSKFVDQIGTTFEEVTGEFPTGKTLVTGMPLRAGIVAPPQVSVPVARSTFAGLDPNRFTVLVTGGSQGARNVNRIVLEAVPSLLDAGMQVLHLTGTRNFEGVEAEARTQGLMEREGYLPRAFCNELEMPLAWRSANVVVCRGGVSTLAESWANRLPTIIVPLPSAYADHQTANARIVERHGAGLLSPEATLTPEQLANDLMRFQQDSDYYARVKAATLTLSRPNAADTVAKEVLKMLGQGA